MRAKRHDDARSAREVLGHWLGLDPAERAHTARPAGPQP